jgi:hypothetical protein
VENRVAVLENRFPAKVRVTDSLEESGNKGIYKYTNNEIELASHLFEKDHPYDAFETLLHESRHAYQFFSIKIKGFHKNLGEVKEWKGAREHYSDENFENYRNNELEIFCRDHAKSLTKRLREEHIFERDLIPVRVVKLHESLKVELRDNYPRPNACDLRVIDDKVPRRFIVDIPNGCKPENLRLSRDDIEQLYQTGRTESGKLRFDRGDHAPQRQDESKQSEREDRQSRQRDRSNDRER